MLKKQNKPYTLPRNDTFSIQQVSSVYHGTESLLILGPKIWELVPSKINQSEILTYFIVYYLSKIKN